MLDFTFTGEAVYQCFGREKGEFVNFYVNNRKLGSQRILDESPVSRSLIDYLNQNPRGYSGTLKNCWENSITIVQIVVVGLILREVYLKLLKDKPCTENSWN